MDISPAEIFGSYSAWKFTKDSWCISFMNGTEYMYLLEGNDKALLLDTGYGVGNLRTFVSRLTEKEIIAANTHFHPDHAAGNGEFEKVYMSSGYEKDRHSVEDEGAVPFDIKKLPFPDYEKIFLHDGDTIELGGRSITAIEAAPAHCNSTIFYYDEKYRLFFCGDDLESAQVMMFDNSNNPEAPYHVRTRLENLRSNSVLIKSMSERIDYLLPNHNGTPVSIEYADDYIELADRIFSGEAIIEDRLNHRYLEMDPKASRLCRVRWKKASIFIDKELLMQVYKKSGEKK